MSQPMSLIEQTHFSDGHMDEPTDGRKGKNNMSPDPSRRET